MVAQSVLHVGPMKSGKSKALLEKAKELEANNISYICFKPSVDHRNGDYLYSRHFKDDYKVPVMKVDYAKQIYTKVIKKKSSYTTVLIDEIMLFDSDILGVIDALYYHKIDLIAAGLNLDFRKMPFPLSDWGLITDNNDLLSMTMEHVMDQFNEIVYHESACEVCGKNARYSQRLIDGEPASFDSPLIIIGDEEYQARCQMHHALKG